MKDQKMKHFVNLLIVFKFQFVIFFFNCDDHISISSVFSQFKPTSFHVSFLSGVKMNSINWSPPNMGPHSLVE